MSRRVRLSKREAALLLAAAVLALSVALWHLLFFPLLQQAAALHSRRISLYEEQARLQGQAERGEALAKKWEEHRSKAEALHTSIPQPERLPDVLARLEALLSVSSLTVHTLQAGRMEAEGSHAALQVRMNLSGEPTALLALLEQLERFEHLLLIEALSWTPGNQDPAALELSFHLIFHPPPAE